MQDFTVTLDTIMGGQTSYLTPTITAESEADALRRAEEFVGLPASKVPGMAGNPQEIVTGVRNAFPATSHPLG